VEASTDDDHDDDLEWDDRQPDPSAQTSRRRRMRQPGDRRIH
jgi:hypothetical protein